MFRLLKLEDKTLKSFGLVEDKIYEADFFLDKIKECIIPQECNYYLSAFLSASRSVTFTLQSSMKGIADFDVWYKEQQEVLKQNKLARKFVVMRNESQKVGISHIGSGTMFRDEEGTLKVKHYFINDDNFIERGELPTEKLIKRIFSDQSFKQVEEDIATQCHQNFTLLIKIIHKCYKKYKNEIDPQSYYTLENIYQKGLTIEDIEENLGFKRGHTDVAGISEENRLQLLRNYLPSSKIDYIFEKYLPKYSNK